jgi:hypothetical protein
MDDGRRGASVNIMPLTVFKRLGHGEKELKRTNLSSSGFSGESATAHGIVSKELTVGSKTVQLRSQPKQAYKLARHHLNKGNNSSG